MPLHKWLACLGDKALRHAWLGTACIVIDIVSEERWSRFGPRGSNRATVIGLHGPVSVNVLDLVCLSGTEVMM